jgi:hypothetical protein
LESQKHICKERLQKRRYNPVNGKLVSLDRLPSDLSEEEVNKWSARQKDTDPSLVNARFEKYAGSRHDLEKFYKVRTSNVHGLFYEVQDTTGNLDAVLEKAEASLLRPIPQELNMRDA